MPSNTGNAAESSRQEADALLKDGKRTEALRQYMNYIRQKDTAADPQVLVDAAKLADSLAFEQPSQETITKRSNLLRHGECANFPTTPNCGNRTPNS